MRGGIESTPRLWVGGLCWGIFLDIFAVYDLHKKTSHPKGDGFHLNPSGGLFRSEEVFFYLYVLIPDCLYKLRI